MTDDIVFLSAATLARRIRALEFSAEEVVEAHLAQIEAVNPLINAVVEVAAGAARAQARECDRVLAGGRVLGPLHGVPFTVKDIFDAAGLVAAAGLVERAGYVPQSDAVAVARLRGAGGILLGKTNVPPGGGGGGSENPVYGRTNNPYALDRTTGGSSSGEAAIIAAGGSPLGLGSDSGGSLRLPAHFCGVTTLKPTSGRVPNTGALYLAGGLSDPRTQVGLLARWVQDLALAFPLIAGPDWQDSGVVPMPIGDPESLEVHGLRLAYYADDGIMPPTAETRATVERVARLLAEAGLRVEETRLPMIETSLEITRRYWRMSQLSGGEVEQLFHDWDAFRSAWLGFLRGYDLVLSPVSHGPAVVHGTMQDVDFSYTLPYSLTGWPVVVVRAGTAPGGLPIGVQLAAPPWREDVALAAASVVEGQGGGWQQSAPLAEMRPAADPMRVARKETSDESDGAASSGQSGSRGEPTPAG
jgi:amidase